MTITVKTKSGSIIVFTEKNGKTFFQKGMLTGEVVRLAPFTIGNEIVMDFHKENFYGVLEEDSMMLRSTPVTEITVIS